MTTPPDVPLSDASDDARLRAALADRYDIQGVVGVGGMATVYRALDRKHNRTVAIKVLPSALSLAVGTDRFLREIAILAALQHPRILALYDSGSADGLLYYVMPFVEGESVRRRLQRDGSIPVAEAMVIAQGVASALAYAHARGIVHRDIKPDNVLLSAGETVVADFGIARVLAHSQDARLTGSGLTLGTPAYMSPEQVTGEADVDARSDIYSLGCLLYEMIAGRPPYAAPTTERILLQHIAAPIPQLAALQPSIPVEVDRVVQRALAKSPDERFATASAMMDALSRTFSGAQAIPVVTGATSPATRGSAGGDWRRWGAWLAGGVVVLVAALLLTKVPRRASVAMDASAIAVLPFRVSGDSSLAYLREGMVDLLTTQLGSTEEMHPLDSRTVLAAWRRSVAPGTDPSTEEAQRLVAGLGGGRLVLGEVIGTGASVTIAARIVGVDGAKRSEASVQGASDSLSVLVDRLTSQLLARSAGEPTRRLAELTSTSLPAVRAYLEGRAAFRRGELGRAVDRFTEALSNDSTFALAALGMASAGAWSQQAAQSAALARGLRTGYALRDRLSARDRLLFEAYVLPSATVPFTAAQQMAAWQRAVERAPESAEAQFEYGDRLYHSGPVLSVTNANAAAHGAFARALALDSTYVAPLAHLVELAARAGDRAQARTLNALYANEAAVADLGPYVRWRVALTLDDRATLDSIRRALPRLRVPVLNRMIGYGQGDGVSLADVDRAAAELRRRLDDGSVEQTNVRPGLTLHAWAMNRGRRADAAHAIDALRAESSDAPGSSIVYLDVDQLPVLDALFWDGDSTAAVAAVARLQRFVAGGRPVDGGGRARYDTDACVVGLWQLSTGDLAGLSASLVQLRAGAAGRDSAVVHGADARFCTLMLEAMRAVRQSSAQAPALVAQLDTAVQQGPYIFGTDFGNLVVARLLEQQGDVAGALRAVRRRPYDWDTVSLYLTTYLREESRLAAQAGDQAGARRANERYLALRAPTAARS
ncbi:MAG: serine/threonine-protein kinase [Gemmatimonadaceae bacterium]